MKASLLKKIINQLDEKSRQFQVLKRMLADCVDV